MGPDGHAVDPHLPTLLAIHGGTTLSANVVATKVRRVLVALSAVTTLVAGAHRADATPRWWARPADQARLLLTAIDEDARRLDASGRDIAGVVSLACEREEGRPCGDGAGGYLEYDAAAGYGEHLVAGTRLRAVAGSGAYDPALSVDRLFVRAAYGPVSAEVGRDVLDIGPVMRTRPTWSANAPPIDHVRGTIAIPRVRATWVGGRLGEPQTYPDNLVSITRLEADLAGFEVGVTQLLQLGGDGAPDLSIADFVLEHVRRADLTAGPTDSSNRRIGLDLVGWVNATRIYYGLVFEDWRDRIHHARRYDADHVFGVEHPRFLVELQKTGVRSQEHVPRTTGFTHRGRAVGSPLGPDAVAAYAEIRLPRVTPWLELVRFSSDTYTFNVDGPIEHTTRGVDEERYRAGARATYPVRRDLRLDLATFVERVTDFAFVEGDARTNLGLSLAAVWTP